jgi:hypothetical protein
MGCCATQSARTSKEAHPGSIRSAPLAPCFRVGTSFLALRAPAGMVSPEFHPPRSGTRAVRPRNGVLRDAERPNEELSWFHTLCAAYLLVPYALRWNLFLGAPRHPPRSGTRAVRRRAPERGKGARAPERGRSSSWRSPPLPQSGKKKLPRETVVARITM